MTKKHARKESVPRERLPRRAKAAGFSNLDKTEIEETVVKLAREGKTTAMIGTILRDLYAVPDVRQATGRTIMEILSENKIVFDIPEDLQALMKRALNLRRHLEAHRKDNNNGRGLLLIESRIRKLAHYYRAKGSLPADWKYSAITAKLTVE
ncbi:MAG: 30S ribosomal protein S15 [Euryarchaeota archaeon]|nr:30S ribosomal protein S15 [Euryarchaeota archaeon]